MEKADTIINRPGFNVLGAIIEPANARMGNGAGAHGARLQRNVEVTIGEPFGIQHRETLPKNKHFRMCCWVFKLSRAIACFGNYGVLFHEDGAHRHLVASLCGLRLGDGTLHE